jgi:hypothetical protein
VLLATPVVTVVCNTVFGLVTGVPLDVVIVTPAALVPLPAPPDGGVIVSPIRAPEVIVSVVVVPFGKVTGVVTLVTV